MIELAIEAYRLKDTVRAGWLLRGIRDPESVADHSWGTALLCLLYAAREGVDPGRCVQIALVHDIAECRVGDIPARVDPAAQPVSPTRKAQIELDAIRELVSMSGEDASNGLPRFAELWEEYEKRSSREALFVRDMNLIDMCLTAYLYERDRRYDPRSGSANFPDFGRLDEFFATSKPRLSTETGRFLFADIYSRYAHAS